MGIYIGKADDPDYSELVYTANKAFFNNSNDICFQTLLPKLYSEQNFSAKEHFIVKEDGVIKAIVLCHTDTLFVKDQALKVGSIGTVCVDISARHRGYMKLLMNETLNDMRRNGTAISFLGGQRQRYENFGYTPSGTVLTCTFTMSNAKHIFGTSDTPAYTFKEEYTDAMRVLHDLQPIHAVRKPDMFYDTVLSWHSTAVAVYLEEEVVGYIVASGGYTNIHEICISCGNDVCAILKSYMEAYKLDAVTVHNIPYFLDDISKRLVCTCEGANVGHTCNVNVIDYVKTLNAFFALKDRLCPGTASFDIDGKCISIEVKDNKAYIKECDMGDIHLTHLQAVSLFFSQISAYRSLLPDFALSWFPLPMCYPKSDNV